jgi:hypothetical protein
MEVVILLLVLIILGYLIYQLFPSTEYKKALYLIDKNNFFEAIKILSKIYNKHPMAPAKLAECKLQLGIEIKSKNENEAISIFNEIINLNNSLPSKANVSEYSLIVSKALYYIIEINFFNIRNLINDDLKIQKLKENLKLIENSKNIGFEKEFVNLKHEHFSDLSLMYLNFGITLEKAANFSYAIKNYTFAIGFAKKSNNLDIFNNSYARIGISKLKNNEDFGSEILSFINKSKENFKRDFYFRYSKRLLSEKKYVIAEEIINTHLNFNSIHVENLKKILNVKKTKDAIKKVKEINFKLEQLYENSFPIEDVKSLYNSSDITIDNVKLFLPSLSIKIEQIKPSLFNRLLSHFIFDEQYEDAINLIIKFPKFWESPELLKNLGMCCFGLTSLGLLTEDNFRSIISCWLTSIFSDNVFLNSIKETSWDDEYSFTFSDSIGSGCFNDILPSNVNHDEPSNVNISIGAAQVELLNQFESLLNIKYSDNNFNKKIIDFYEFEKKSIENVATLAVDNIFIASPYFTISFDLTHKVIDALDLDFAEFSVERTLKSGLPYCININSGFVYNYKQATVLVDSIINAIISENITKLITLFTNENKILINKFDTISNSFQDNIFNTILLRINLNNENEKLIPIMNECINFSQKNDKLKFQYSNFVADLCIEKVNKDIMNNYIALGLMYKAYVFSKDSSRICKNLITLIKYNLLDYLNDDYENSISMFKLITEIQNNRSDKFHECNEELKTELKNIEDVLKSHGLSIHEFIRRSNSSLNHNFIKLKKITISLFELTTT